MRAGKFRKARDAFKALNKSQSAQALPLLIEANLGLANEMIAKGLVSEESPICPCCGCDLTKAAAARAAACQHTKASAASLRSGDSAASLEHAAYAWSLSHLPAIPPLAYLAALHSRKLSDPALWRTRLTRH